MLKSLQNLGYNYNFSPKERAGLGIEHDDDEDLTDNFNYKNWIKRIMLLQLRLELSGETFQETSNNVNTAINQTVEESVVDKISQLRGANAKRGFDRNRFYMLEKDNDSSTEGSSSESWGEN
jgi:hypothetical protein